MSLPLGLPLPTFLGWAPNPATSRETVGTGEGFQEPSSGPTCPQMGHRLRMTMSAPTCQWVMCKFRRNPLRGFQQALELSFNCMDRRSLKWQACLRGHSVEDTTDWALTLPSPMRRKLALPAPVFSYVTWWGWMKRL